MDKGWVSLKMSWYTAPDFSIEERRGHEYTWPKWSARDKTASLTKQSHILAPNQLNPSITQPLPDNVRTACVSMLFCRSY